MSVPRSIMPFLSGPMLFPGVSDSSGVFASSGLSASRKSVSACWGLFASRWKSKYPTALWTDKHVLKHYPSQTSLAGGNTIIRTQHTGNSSVIQQSYLTLYLAILFRTKSQTKIGTSMHSSKMRTTGALIVRPGSLTFGGGGSA